MAGGKLIHHLNVPISDRKRTRDWYEKVMGAEFLDRKTLIPRQLQMRIGTGEMQFTDTPNPAQWATSLWAHNSESDSTSANRAVVSIGTLLSGDVPNFN